MNLASASFLAFLAAVALIYPRFSRRLQPIALLAASLTFYALFNWRFLGVLLLLIAVNYVSGREIDRAQSLGRKKVWLAISLFISLGFLGYLKYFGFFANSAIVLAAGLGFHFSPIMSHIVLPVGISFYTFQMLTYTLDIYRGQIKPTTSFLFFVAEPV